MYIATVPNRNSPPAILLRESYREGGKVKTRTLGNISHLPPEQIEGIRRVLRGEQVFTEDDLEILASRAHGSVSLVLAAMGRAGLAAVLAPRRSRERDLAMAMVAGRVLMPKTKLASIRAWQTTTLPELLEVDDATEDDLYAAMDWLTENQPAIERRLARKYLKDGAIVLYDISSSFMTGRHCPLAKHGYSRDHRRDLPQVVYGVITDGEGCPVAVEVFEGNTSDTTTVMDQVEKLRDRFGLQRIIFVGDRGMIKQARIEALRARGGVDWVSALDSRQVQKLRDGGSIQLGLFDEKDLVEIQSEDFPGERVVVCRNPALAAERARKRRELLAATEAALDKVVASVQAGRLKAADKIALRVGRVIGRFKMRKHFLTDISQGHFSYSRNEASIQYEAELDGLYAIRTSLTVEQEPSAEQIVRTYKRLTRIERIFRSMKTTQLLVRPIHHRTADRVRAHIFLCMLAAHVIWHLEQALAPWLFTDPGLPEQKRAGDPVAPPRRTPEGRRKVAEQTSADDHPLHSLRTLLDEMATLTRTTLSLRNSPLPPWDKDARPSGYQRTILAAVGVNV